MELLKEIRKDLRALDKNGVLNKCYLLENGEKLGLKATKCSVMGIRLWNTDGSIKYDGASIWDTTQKCILAYVERFING